MAQVDITDLQQQGWYITSDGFAEFTEDGKTTLKAVIDSALDLDIKEFGLKKLPDLQKGKPESIKGPLVLQLTKLRNISAPKAHEESQGAPPLYRLTLTDGHVQIIGIDMEKIPRLGVDTPPGTKVKLVGEITISSGHLLLDGKNCQILGGRVEKLVRAWEAQKLSYQPRTQEGAEAPPPFLPFGSRKGQGDQRTGTGPGTVKKGGKPSTENSKKSDDCEEEKKDGEFEAQRQANIEAAINKPTNTRSFQAGKMERDLDKLVDMGFNEKESRIALQQHGDVSSAAAALTEDYPPLNNGYTHGHRGGYRGGRGRGAPAYSYNNQEPPREQQNSADSRMEDRSFDGRRGGPRGRGDGRRGRGGRRRFDGESDEGGDDHFRKGPSEKPMLNEWFDKIFPSSAKSNSASNGPSHPPTSGMSSNAAPNSNHRSGPPVHRSRMPNSDSERRTMQSETPPRFLKNKEDRSRNTSGQSSTDSASNTTGHNSPVHQQHHLPASLNPPGIPARSGRGGGGGGNSMYQNQRYENQRYENQRYENQRYDNQRYGNPRANGYNNTSSNNYYRGQNYDMNGMHEGGNRSYRGMERRGRGRGYGGNNAYTYRNQRGGRGGGSYQGEPSYYHHHHRNEQPSVAPVPQAAVMMDYPAAPENLPSLPVESIMPPGQYVAPPPMMSMGPAVQQQPTEQSPATEAAAPTTSGDLVTETPPPQGEPSRSSQPAEGAVAVGGQEMGEPQQQPVSQQVDTASIENKLEVLDIVAGDTSLALPLNAPNVMGDVSTGVPIHSPDGQNYYQYQMMLGSMTTPAANYGQYAAAPMTMPQPRWLSEGEAQQMQEPQQQMPPERHWHKLEKCAAKCPFSGEDKYFRGVVQGIGPNGDINIFFYDLGQAADVPSSDVQEVPEDTWNENKVAEYFTSAPVAQPGGFVPMVQAPGFIMSGVPNAPYFYDPQAFTVSMPGTTMGGNIPVQQMYTGPPPVYTHQLVRNS